MRGLLHFRLSSSQDVYALKVPLDEPKPLEDSRMVRALMRG
jgi:hypothetical protein